VQQQVGSCRFCFTVLTSCQPASHPSGVTRGKDLIYYFLEGRERSFWVGFLQESLFRPVFKPGVITIEGGGVPRVFKLHLKSLATYGKPENPHGEILHFCLTGLTGIKVCWLPIFAMAAVELDQDKHSRKKCKLLHST